MLAARPAARLDRLESVAGTWSSVESPPWIRVISSAGGGVGLVRRSCSSCYVGEYRTHYMRGLVESCQNNITILH